MKKARGTILKLIKVLDEIQTLSGQAKGAYQDDRDPMRFDHVVEPLDRIFELCMEARSLYEPTDLATKGK